MTDTAPSALTLKPAQARKALAARELARRHLVDFSQLVHPWYKAARHHRLVASYLEQVETYIRTGGRTGIGRLLVFMPPQNGKTEQVSKHFPAWLMGRMCALYQQPCYVITASYNSDRATDNSRAVREIVMGNEYRTVFGDLASVPTPVTLSADSRSVEKWDLAAPCRGGMLAAGMGGGVTGFGANLFVIDDPFKNREEAESPDRRELVWDWWLSSAYTRLRPGAAVVGMLTRWHGDDWSGRLIKQMASNPLAEKWVIVNLPAIWESPVVPEGKTFEEYQRSQALEGVWIEREDLLGRSEGEALWPEWYPRDWLDVKRANIGPYDWEALYQQSPYVRAGSMFKREWFPVVDAPPRTEEITCQVRYWDKAGTAGGGAYTCGALLAMTNDKIVYVLHVVRGQWSSYERELQMVQTAQLDIKRPGPPVLIWHEQEPGSGGKESAEATNRRMASAGFAAHFEPVTGSKESRAEPWSSQAEGGGIRLLRGGWNAAYVEEHVSFPKGKFKDQVDASDGAFGKLHTAVGEVGVRWL